jgi:FtsP/CotA-like multicopper oxidase with cupredoxin domain/Cu/Ag efflux protein CusF
MNSDRRSFFARLTSAATGLWAGSKITMAQDQQVGQPVNPQSGVMQRNMPGMTMPKSATDNLPVVMPDLHKLPHKMVDGVKEFHLIAEVVRTEFVPGRLVDAWGFNGSVPGPTIEVNQGDQVRVIFDNHLPEMTAVHWHGFEVPMEMDGSVGLGQDPVPPGGRFVYEFTLHQAGTFFYHSHFAMQEMMGMMGMFIMHPKTPFTPAVHRDFGIVIQEWALLPNNTVPNTLSMEFNWLTFNGKAGPACTPMLVKQGERVRIRMINMGMDHHPIHLHGYQFAATGTESGRTPQHLWYDQNTVIVGVAQARDIEFDAKYVGDWMLHCHLPHHMMNQMASMVGPVMSSGQGLRTGAGMAAGMGIVRQGNPLSEELGPSFGRGLGLAADVDRLTSHLVGQQPTAPQGHDMSKMGGMTDPAMDMYPKDDPEKKKIPGYPQDMWMPADAMFQKPENDGLRKGWSGAMGGMMTLVRVLPPERYDQIMRLVQEKAQQSPGEKKPDGHVLLGKVEAVSESTGKLTVSHGDVEGWMGAMTMAYGVDKPEILKSIKAGNQIEAKVYDGDYMLHDVEVVPASKGGK